TQANPASNLFHIQRSAQMIGEPLELSLALRFQPRLLLRRPQSRTRARGGNNAVPEPIFIKNSVDISPETSAVLADRSIVAFRACRTFFPNTSNSREL